MRILINKLVMKKGAIFDYEEIVCDVLMEQSAFRSEVEERLKGLAADKEQSRIQMKDKKTGKDLTLFLKKGYHFGLMQIWFLEGICETSDYEEWMDKTGIIKEWLEVELL